MKHHVRTLACGIALLVTAALLGACGGKQTIASKSAAAYDEARKKGLPVSAGEHGGHEAGTGSQAATTSTQPPNQEAMPAMDHSTMAGMDHSAMAGMDHSQMTATDHGAMPGMHQGTGDRQHEMAGMDHSAMAGMDHSQMPGMQHGGKPGSAREMPAMDHSSMKGMDHSQMSGMQHGAQSHDMSAMQHGSMAGMQHGSMTNMQHGSAAPLVIAPPTSNAAIAHTQPASTLRQDEFDAPAPSAVDEAAKAAPKPPSHGNHNGGSEDQR